MKPFFLLGVCLATAAGFPAVTLYAAGGTGSNASGSNHPTAYTALRTVQKALGIKALEQVVEVTGRDGVPQPYVWKVTLREPDGTREVDVAAGKITGQHKMPGKFVTGTGTLHLQELNLDSSGAFDAANAQALKVRVRFDSLNYVLAIGDGGKPVWTLELFNQDGGSIGRMRLAAYNGTIASVDGRLATTPAPGNAATTTPSAPALNRSVTERRPPTPASDSASHRSGTTTTTTVYTEHRSSAAVIDDGNESGFFTRAGRTIDRTNRQVAESVVQTKETVKRGFKRTGAKIQRFFVGHSDLDRDEDRE